MESTYIAPWEPGASYHVYNRAVALNRLFCSRYNVYKFRAVLIDKVCPYFEVYSLSCVGNHFHLHGRVRILDTIVDYLHSLPRLLGRQRRYLDGTLSFQALLGDAFARAFQAYARSFNLEQGRTGSLMDQTVRRVRVRGDLLSRSLCAYHHYNALKHGLWDGLHGLGDMTTYAEIVRGESELVALDAIYERFGGVDGFVSFHERYLQRKRRSMMAFDEARYFGYTNYPEQHRWELYRGEGYRDRA